MIVSLTSARSSPGVTSLAVGMAYVWQELGYQPLLVEADPAGGVLGLRFDLPSEPSFTTLSADLRRGSDPQRIIDNTAEIQGVRTLLSSVDPAQAGRVLTRSGGILAAELPSLRRPVVIDAGRLGADSPAIPLLQASHQVLVLCRPRVEEAQAMLFGLRLLRGLDCRCGLVVVGERGPHDPHEIAALAGVPLVAVLPDDAVLAAALTGGLYNEKRLKRSLLWRSIAALSRSVLQGPTAGPALRPAAAPPAAPAPAPAPAAPHQVDPVVAAQAPAATTRSLPAGVTAPAPAGNIATPQPMPTPQPVAAAAPQPSAAPSPAVSGPAMPAAPIPVGLAVAAAQAAALRPSAPPFNPAVTGELPRLDRAGTLAPPPPPAPRPAPAPAQPPTAVAQPVLAPGVMAHWPPPTPKLRPEPTHEPEAPVAVAAAQAAPSAAHHVYSGEVVPR